MPHDGQKTYVVSMKGELAPRLQKAVSAGQAALSIASKLDLEGTFDVSYILSEEKHQVRCWKEEDGSWRAEIL